MRELSDEQAERLVAAAFAVRERAHAPYSGFAVGAALLDSAGRIHVGCNVENASFGLSICAERNAVAAAVAAGAEGFCGIAVVTSSDPPATPCGACRQVLAEFGDFPVVLANLDGTRRLARVGELLPAAFGGAFLHRNPG